MTSHPGDFGGKCLVGECAFDAELLLPSSTYFGLAKSGSHLYGTLRNQHGNMRRVLRACGADQSMMSWLFVAEPGCQLQRHARSEDMWRGPISITRNGHSVEFADTGAAGQRFRFLHTQQGCSWDEGEILSLTGDLIAPAVQWFNTWSEGACFAVTAKYRVRGSYLGEPVEGFVGHEIHYFTTGFNWLNAPYGLGREFCWQQIANEYEDGSLVQATFAYGAGGWGFAMVHDENGAFVSTTDVRAQATVRANGYPESIRYEFGDQSWTWRIDPQGERPALPLVAVRGADGVCARDDDDRSIRYSMGNSDWWTDGRADAIVMSGR